MNHVMRKFLTLLLLFAGVGAAAGGAGNPALGYWQIPDDDTGKPQSIAALYEHGGACFVRMVAIYSDDGKKIVETLASPKDRAKGIAGHPHIAGLDFIWGLVPPSGKGRMGGKVINPDTGNVWDCEVWVDADTGKLVVRGKFLFFGVNEYWLPIAESLIPESARIDASKIVPKIPDSAR